MKMNKIDLKNLDKSTWTTFRFDQIASSISKRVDPNETDLKYYIGLEHIDSDNIHITRMGAPDDVNGQKLRCYPGDVIFGRRRAYQRKAAVCEVDGFCSAHSLVLRANPEIIDPKLFPFFLHSDAFMHRAVDISVGSLSPTINWGTLKKQEFLIPPQDQQTQLAELLWAMDAVIGAYKQDLILHKKLRNSILYEKLFLNRSREKAQEMGWRYCRLEKLIDSLETGPCVKYLNDRIDEQAPSLLKTSSVSTNRLLPKESFQVVDSDIHKLKVSLKKHSIIISRINTAQLVGASAFVDKDYPSLFLPDRLWQTVISKADINSRWLSFVLSSPIIRSQISRLCAGTSNSMKYITKEIFLSITVPVPPFDQQCQLAGDIQLVDSTIMIIENSIAQSKQLQKSLINQVF